MLITSVVIESTGNTVQTNVPQTFGHVFSKGHLPAGYAVDLIAPDGTAVPCQIDVFATHNDGSVKHAALSAFIPSLSPTASITYGIKRRAAKPTSAAPVPADFPGLNAVATITDNGTDADGPNAGTVYTADASVRLGAGSYETWLSGPIVSEWLVRVPFVSAAGVEHPGLHARFNIRAYKGQSRAKVDCIIENNWARPKAVASAGTPWESASETVRVYNYALKIGGATVDTRALAGYLRVRITGATGGTYDGQSTRIPNNATLYTASVTINGATKAISIAGSAMQTYGQLRAAINAQIGSVGACNIDEGFSGIRFVAPGAGAGSIVNSINYGTLFPALTLTGLANNATTYTATITANGTLYSISVVGNTAQTFGQLCALLNAQTNGVVTCTPQVEAPGIKFTLTATGQEAGVTVTDGTLFAITKLKSFVPYRPIRGDEYIHYPATRWKKTFWWGGEPAAHIRHNKAYLAATRAVPNYAPELTGDTNAIAARLAEMKGNEDIGRNGITKASMPAPGGAPGIGILPEWQAMWFVSQHPDAKYVMLKQADLMGSWPVIFRDYDTDKPVSFARWPYATLSPNAGDSRNPATGFNEKLFSLSYPPSIPGNGNGPDVAHHPDFNFLPYLATCDHFYMEGLLFYFVYTCLSQNPHANYRDGGKVLFRREQVRGQGWMFRSLAHNRYLLPDNHGHRPELEYIAASNVTWYSDNYVNPAGPLRSIFGHWHGLAYTVNGQAGTGGSSFMEDFATQALGRSIELGFDELMPLFGYKTQHLKGRLLSGPAFCWQMATTYALRYKATSASPEYTSWAEVYQGSASANVLAAACGSVEMGAAIGEGQNAMPGYPTSTEGFPANLQPAVAYAVSHGIEAADDAWLVFEGRSKRPNYNTGPQFAILPRETLVAPDPEPDPDPTPDPETPPPPPIDTIIMDIADRVKDTTTSTGTGPLTLSGTPPMNFNPFLTSPIRIGSVIPCSTVHRTLPEWETARYTLTAALTLERTTIIASSNNGQAVNFSAGIKDVSCDVTAALIDTLAGDHNVTIQTVGDSTQFKFLVTDGTSDKPKKIPLADVGISSSQVPLLELPLRSTDMLVDLYRPGFGDGAATLTALAAAVAAINGNATPADTTAPVLSSPSGSASGTTTSTGTVTTNEATGTLYCLASTTDTATATQVKAGLSQAITSTGVKTFSIAALNASTTYYLHFLHKDAAGNESAIVKSLSFATSTPGDTQAPTLSSPVGTQTGQTTASGSVTTNEANGTLYSLHSTSNVATAAAVKAGASQAVTATGAQTVAKTGLTAATTYYIHYLHRDAAGNDSSVSTSPSFTTASAAPTGPLTITTPATQQAGVVFTLAGTYTGTAPTALDYSWDGITWYPPDPAATIGNGTWSLPMYVNAENASQTVRVRNRSVPTDTATSAPFAVTAPKAYAITGYGTPANSVEVTVDATAKVASGSKKALTAADMETGAYWLITPNPPASALLGYTESATIVPAQLTGTQNTGGQMNGFKYSGRSGANAYAFDGNCWVPATGAPVKRYLWIKPVDGVAVCVNPSGATITVA